MIPINPKGNVFLKGTGEYKELVGNLHRSNKCKSQTRSSLGIILPRNVSEQSHANYHPEEEELMSVRIKRIRKP